MNTRVSVLGVAIFGFKDPGSSSATRIGIRGFVAAGSLWIDRARGGYTWGKWMRAN
jgi:hypothetical protein